MSFWENRFTLYGLPFQFGDFNSGEFYVMYAPGEFQPWINQPEPESRKQETEIFVLCSSTNYNAI